MIPIAFSAVAPSTTLGELFGPLATVAVFGVLAGLFVLVALVAVQAWAAAPPASATRLRRVRRLTPRLGPPPRCVPRREHDGRSVLTAAARARRSLRSVSRSHPPRGPGPGDQERPPTEALPQSPADAVAVLADAAQQRLRAGRRPRGQRPHRSACTAYSRRMPAGDRETILQVLEREVEYRCFTRGTGDVADGLRHPPEPECAPVSPHPHRPAAPAPDGPRRARRRQLPRSPRAALRARTPRTGRWRDSDARPPEAWPPPPCVPDDRAYPTPSRRSSWSGPSASCSSSSPTSW